MYNIAVPYLLSVIAFTINSVKRCVVVSIRSTQNEQIGRTYFVYLISLFFSLRYSLSYLSKLHSLHTCVEQCFFYQSRGFILKADILFWPSRELTFLQ